MLDIKEYFCPNEKNSSNKIFNQFNSFIIYNLNNSTRLILFLINAYLFYTQNKIPAAIR